MAHKCDRCGGAGFIKKFSAVANGECFRCMGTGSVLTPAERARIAKERNEAIDMRMAKEQGVTLHTLQAYLSPSRFGVEIPKHANGCSYSIKEFEEWLNAA